MKKPMIKRKVNITQIALAVFSLISLVLGGVGIIADYVAVIFQAVAWVVASTYLTFEICKVERWEEKAQVENAVISEWLREVKIASKKIMNWTIYMIWAALLCIAGFFVFVTIAIVNSETPIYFAGGALIIMYPTFLYALPIRKRMARLHSYTLQKFYRTPKTQYLASTLLQNRTLSIDERFEMLKNIEAEYEKELKEAK